MKKIFKNVKTIMILNYKKKWNLKVIDDLVVENVFISKLQGFIQNFTDYL